MTSTAYRVLGSPVGRADGPEKVTGQGKYTEDIILPGMLWAKVLRSPYAHARIVRVDASKALSLPGVHAVLTGEDVKGMRTGKRLQDEPILAWDRVLFIGDEVAAVAADDEDIAQQALDLIDVEYEELPALFEVEDALRPGAPVLHPELNSYTGLPKTFPIVTNVLAQDHWERGNIQEGFAQADLIVERVYRTQRTHQAYLEPHSSMVHVDTAGHVQVWIGSKSPFGNKNQIAALLKIQPKDVTVNFAYVGGDFGGKGDISGVPIGYFFAKKTGRPVKMVWDYSEELLAMNPRHESIMRVKVGVKRDGTLTAWESNIHFNSGAYGSYKPVPSINLPGAAEIAGPYRIPHVLIDSYQVYTNTVPGGFHRSPGEFQGIFAGESHMDEIARELGMDPVELRLKNLIHEGDPLPAGHHYKDIRIEEVLREAVRASGYYDEKPSNVGRGVAIGHRTQGGGETHVGVTIQVDGTIIANTSIYEPGTGTYTILRQVVAEELGVDPERVHVIPWNTDDVTFDQGVGGARVSYVTSQGAFMASTEVKTKLRRLAAEFMGWNEERISFRDGDLVNDQTGQRTPIAGVVRRAGQPVNGRGDINETVPNPYTSFVAQVAEVSVDRETGEVKVQRITAVHDAGRVINPIGFHGQVEGGMVQALGQAMMEDLIVEQGRVINPSFADFKIPTARDIPELNTVVLESPIGRGNYQIKAVGEHSNITTAPAIANAIADACGVRLAGLPLSPEKLWKALKESR